MKKANYVPSLAIVVGLLLIGWSINLTGDIRGFVSVDGLVITILGSFAALTVSFPVRTLKKIPSTLKILFITKAQNRQEIISKFAELAKKSRREGFLSLEDDIEELDNEFMRAGIQMIVDGVDPDIIKRTLVLKIDTMERRHVSGQEVFTRWGDLAPAFGMIGTLIGLITMLSKLDDPSAIGVGMATALLTTFYGSLLANLVFIPIASNLHEQSQSELYTAELVVDGILEIQAGTNPRMIEEKLVNYLTPEEQLKLAEANEDGGEDA